MPVEIKELVIRTIVNDASQTTDMGPVDGSIALSPGASGVNTDAIVQECVRQVMALMTKNRER
jgi:hypothetical protein